MSRVVWSGSKHSASNLGGGAESEPGISNSKPSGKMPEALEMPSDPAARASRLLCRVRKPHGRNDRLSKWNWRRFSRKRSCSWRCCGLRKVPLVQITGCSRFIWNHSNRTGAVSQALLRCYPLGMAQTNPEPQPARRLAPRLGSDAEFAAVRGMLAECGFTPERICQRLGIAGMGEYKPIWRGRGNLLAAEQALDALILLLMDGEFVAGETLQRLLPAGAGGQMEALGVVARDQGRGELWFGGWPVFPTRGMVLGSDRVASPDRDPLPMTADAVYPAGIENTVAFMATLPETPCEALLDIGTGTGIAALDGARLARHAWGTDIAARSVQFAEFNRRLNGIENARVLMGDLYAPVEGLTFDRIVTHPPYVPAPKNTMIFRDGGEDGEQILRRIVEGVPRFLRPGGRFC